MKGKAITIILALTLCIALAVPALAVGAYEGEYDTSGKRSGTGVWVYEDYRYEGQWKDGAPNGVGTLYWERSGPIENKEEGHTYAMKTILTGSFVNGYAHGAVTEVWHMDNGEVHTWKFTVDMGHSLDTLVWSTTSQADLTINPDTVYGAPPWSGGETPEGEDVPETPPPAPVAALVARPTASKVLVNSKDISFDAYNINDNNYFKLRDLAYVLSGTEKQFQIGWDGAKDAITLTSGEPYTPVGGEMASKGEGNKTPTASTATIYLDGEEVSFTAYNIDGNNYFKLRDIGAAFDFGIKWDGEKSTIVIDTSIGYTPE